MNPVVLSIGLLTTGALFYLQRLWPKSPSSLFAILASSLAVQLLNLDVMGMTLIGDPGSLRQPGLRFHIPAIPLKANTVQMLIIGASAVVLLDSRETFTIAKSIGLKSGQRIDTSRELVGRGLASIVGGIFQSLPTSGSLIRSAINCGEGATTQVSGGLSGVYIFLSLMLVKN